MKLLDKIKRIINKKTTILKTMDSKDIISYDTSLIQIPKYSQLSKESKNKVNEYIKKINLEDLNNLIAYPEQLYKDAQDNTELLLKLFFLINEKPFESELNKLSKDKINEKRLESLILIEELKLYVKELNQLLEESILKTVALERYKNKEFNRIIDFLGIFGKAERIKRNSDLNTLESVVNDIKLCKKRIEFLIETVKREIGNSINTSISLETYNRLININEDNSKEKELMTKNILIDKINEILSIIKIIKHHEYKELEEVIKSRYNEEELIKLIAKYKREIDLYAYQNKDEIEELNSRVLKLIKYQKNIDNKDHFLNLISEIETMYKIFRPYLREEYLLNFYQLKFDVLCIGLNLEKESPFKNIKDEQELSYYKKVVELKLERIITGKNEFLKEEFGVSLNDAVKLIKRLIKKEIGNYSGENILNNKKILAFLLAFDKQDGLVEFIKGNYFNKKDLVYNLDNGEFEWNDELSLESIYQLEEMVGNIYNTFKYANQWINLLYFGKVESKISKIEYGPDLWYVSITIPEGLRILKNTSDNLCNLYELTLKKHLKLADEIKCPSTLEKIEKFLFDMRILKEIELNEGLIEIGDNVFDGSRIQQIKFPTTLEKIGENAFANCNNLKEVIFNNRLNFIGRGAFSYCKNLKNVEIPKTLCDLSNFVFDNCCSLENVVFNEGIKSIGVCAFASCMSLKKIIFPKTLRLIGSKAFCTCLELENIVFNDGLIEIYENAFSNCFKIRKVMLPKTLRFIDVCSFFSCEGIEELVLNEGVKIKQYAFLNLISLNKLSVPPSYIYIGCAFDKWPLDRVINRKINLIVRGIEIEDGCLEQYLISIRHRLKSICIMDSDKIAVYYEINSDNVEKIVNEIKQKIEEYKMKKKSDEENIVVLSKKC